MSVDAKGPKIRRGTPSVDLQRIRTIKTFEVMDEDLDKIDTLVAGENLRLGMFTLCVGIFVPTLIAWQTSPSLTTNATVIYAVAVIVSAVFSLFFGAAWRIAARERPRLLERIKERVIDEAVQAE
jgi:hypothetical protein